MSLPGGRICGNCRRYLSYHPETCPECLQVAPLAYPSLNNHELTVCARCAKERSAFACATCGREDHPYGHRRCARCILTERVTELLTSPSTRRVHNKLQPVFDALVSSDRPQTAITWLTRPPGHGPALLRRMAAGEVAISHDTFRQLPMDRSRNYLRDLLSALGVLEPYEPRIERITPWLAELTSGLTDTHRSLTERFARWVVIRRLYDTAERDQLTKGKVQSARHTLKQTVTLLAALDEAKLHITRLTQTQLEAYLDPRAQHTASTIVPFTRWLNRTGINNRIRLDHRASGTAQVVMSETERWTHVKTLLHDDSISRYTRIAGLFMLLFAQPITTITRMRSAQIHADPDRVFVTFKNTPIEMPEPLGQLIRAQLADRGQASYASRNTQWLFPGGIPGRHLMTENIRGKLVELGIQPHTARHAALFALAAQVPHMILAQTLGISHSNATIWAALAARDWSNYITTRTE